MFNEQSYKTPNSSNEQGLIKSIFQSIIISFTFVLVFTFFVYLLLSLGWIQITTLKPIYIYGNYFAIFLGAIITGALMHGRGWLTGLIFGLIYFILAAIIAPVWKIEGIVASIFFFRLLITLVLGSLGGMFGVNI